MNNNKNFLILALASVTTLAGGAGHFIGYACIGYRKYINHHFCGYAFG